MYEIKFTPKDDKPVVLKVETKQRARGIAQAAKESGVEYEVTFNPEPRKVEFDNL